MTARATDDTTAACARAALVTALQQLAAAADQAVTAGRVRPALAPRATEQLAKAVRALEGAPSDPTMLLVHLTAARSFLVEGWGPPGLAQALGVAIARVHQLARTAPEVFRGRPDEAAEGLPAPRLLP